MRAAKASETCAAEAGEATAAEADAAGEKDDDDHTRSGHLGLGAYPAEPVATNVAREFEELIGRTVVEEHDDQDETRRDRGERGRRGPGERGGRGRGGGPGRSAHLPSTRDQTGHVGRHVGDTMP